MSPRTGISRLSWLLITILIASATSLRETGRPRDSSRKPRITAVTKSQLKDVGDSVTVACSVRDGGDHPMLWYKLPNEEKGETTKMLISAGNTLLLPDERMEVKIEPNYNSLQLNNLKDSDFGTYQCRVGNSNVSANVDIFIRSPPLILNTSSTFVVVKEGQDAALSCYATGYPEPIIYWSRDEHLTVDKFQVQGNLLTLPNITKEGGGRYFCLAVNSLGERRHEVDMRIVFPPTILEATTTTNVVVPEGETAVLACHADGFPIPDIYWSKNQHFSPEKSKVIGSVVNITRITRDKRGSYYCLAKNNLGETRHTVNVNVVFPPVILENSSTTVVVPEDGTAVLACHADGYPVPEIYWSRNEHFTWDEAKVFGSVVNITGITREKSGVYYCLGKNDIGETRHRVNVNVVFPPTILDNFTKLIIVPEGATAVLNCNADGNPVPNIFWSKNKSFTAEEAQVLGSAVKITNITREKRGAYYCLAKNDLGESRRTVTVNVVFAPTILDNSSTTVEVLEGETAVLNCHADGYPVPKIFWSNTENFTWDESQVFGSDVNITEITRKQSGSYYCLAMNSLGETRHTVNVNVVYPPEILYSSSTNVEVTEGGTAVLNCNVDGNPVPKIFWHTNENFTVEDSQVFGSVLNITGITRKFRGRYFCLAQNNLGESRHSVDVAIAFPPVLLPNNSTITVSEGGTANLTCSVDGYPPPSISWSLDDENFNVSESRIRGRVLNLKHITRSNRGRYYCLAANRLGEIRQSIDVEVEFPPVIDAPSTLTDRPPMGNIVLECLVIGFPLPSIKWIHSNTEINNDEHYTVSQSNFNSSFTYTTLSITSLQSDHFGLYACTAENKLGVASTNIRILERVVRGLSVISPAAVNSTANPSVSTDKTTAVTDIVSPSLNSVEDSPPIDTVSPSVSTAKTSPSIDIVSPSVNTAKTSPSINIVSQSVNTAKPLPSIDIVSPSVNTAKTSPSIDIVSPSVDTAKTSPSIDIVSPSFESVKDTPIVDAVSPSIESVKNAPIVDAVSSSFESVKNTPIIDTVSPSFDSVKDTPIADTLSPSVNTAKRTRSIETVSPSVNTAKTTPSIDIVDPLFSLAKNDMGESGHTVTANKFFPPTILENSNRLGEIRPSIDVEVEFPPVIDAPSTLMDRPAMGNIVLECHVTGFPLPSIKWIHSNTEIINDDHYTVSQSNFNSSFTNATLSITSLQSDHFGLYACTAENKLGVASTNIRILERVVPRFPVLFPAAVKSTAIPSTSTAKTTVVTDIVSPFLNTLKDTPIVDTVSPSFDSVKDTSIVDTVSPSFESVKDTPIIDTVSPSFESVRDTPSINTVSPSVNTAKPLLSNDIVSPSVNTAKTPPTVDIVSPAFNTAKITPSIDTVSPSVYAANTSPTVDIVSSSFDSVKDTPIVDNFSSSFDSVKDTPIIDTVSPSFDSVKDTPIIDTVSPSFDSVKDTPIADIVSPSVNTAKRTRSIKTLSPSVITAKTTPSVNIVSPLFSLAQNDLGESEHTVTVNKFFAPTILENSSTTIEVLEGETAVLNCHADGHPVPKIFWSNTVNFYWDESQVFGSVVNITGITREKSGSYYCLAMNSLGQSRHTVTVNVVYPPKILESSSTNVEVIEGETAVLNCNADGNPVPKIFWHTQANFTAEDSQVFGSVLNITGITRKFKGRYYCLAQNNLGESRHSVDVAIAFPPILLPANSSITVSEGETASLICPVDGYPPPLISWSLGNENFNASESRIRGRVLNLKYITRNKRGRYHCLATNRLGEIRQSIDVEVEFPPVIDAPSTLMDRPAMGNIVLECHVTGFPLPSVKWSHSNTEIINGDHYTVSQSNFNSSFVNATLSITSLESDYFGLYACTAENKLGVASTNIRILERVVRGIPVRFPTALKSTAIPSTSTAKTTVVPDIVSPSVNTAKTSRSIDIVSLAENDLRGNGQTVSENVLFPPTILDNSSTTVEILEGETAVLDCHTDGYPVPKIFWSKNENFNWDESQVFGSVLNITGITREKSGSYYCLAKNSLGETRHTVNVNVVYPPEILESSSTNVEVNEGGTAVLTCNADGNPVPKIFWHAQENFTAEDSLVFGSVLNITGITRKFRGRYFCLAQNNLGESRHSVDVEIAFPPTLLPTNSSITVSEGGTASLTCSVYGYPTPSISWSSDNKNFNASESGILNLKHITSSNRGRYYCLATNRLGEIRQSIDVEVESPSIIDTAKRTPSINIVSPSVSTTEITRSIETVSPSVSTTEITRSIDMVSPSVSTTEITRSIETVSPSVNSTKTRPSIDILSPSLDTTEGTPSIDIMSPSLDTTEGTPSIDIDSQSFITARYASSIDIVSPSPNTATTDIVDPSFNTAKTTAITYIASPSLNTAKTTAFTETVIPIPNIDKSPDRVDKVNRFLNKVTNKADAVAITPTPSFYKADSIVVAVTVVPYKARGKASVDTVNLSPNDISEKGRGFSSIASLDQFAAAFAAAKAKFKTL